MSGARALASARRRRAEPQANTNVSPISNTPVTSSSITHVTSSSKMTANMTPVQEETSDQRTKMSPAMMLISHNKIIENLQVVIDNLNTKLEQQEHDMKKMIEDNMDNNKVDDNSLEFYKNKIMTIDNSLEEIKKHTLKVQTFSMETNLQMVELKKKFNRYEKKEQDNQDKQREQIIEHINKISTILTKINYEVEENKEIQNIQNNTLVDILQGMNNNITGENVIEAVKEGDEEAVKEDNEKAVEEDNEEAVEEDNEEAVEGDNEEAVEGDNEEAVEEAVEEDGSDEEGEEATKLNF